MSSFKDSIPYLSLEQLNEFKNVIVKAIADKKAEETRVVWQVLNGHITIGNFHYDDYSDALNCLIQAASKSYAKDKNALAELQFSIEVIRVPVSEYDNWFKWNRQVKGE